MTERLYLQDAYTSSFAARIVERGLWPDGRLAVALDRTAFCPGVGGLLADRGVLNRVQVAEVLMRESDGEILHMLSEEIWEDQVQARIDWPRRVDGMRQHTAGHLLASAFAQACGAATVGIGVTEREAFLDLDKSDVAPAHIEQAEAAANEVVLGNRAVRMATLDAAQAAKIGLSVPLNQKAMGSGAAWPLQVMSVEGTGVTACNGVHVARTSEVGLIKVFGSEPLGHRLRVRFVAGARALAEVRHVDQTLGHIAASLGVSAAQAEPAVTRLMVELNATLAELETVRGRALGAEADVLAANAETVGGVPCQASVCGARCSSTAPACPLITTRPACGAVGRGRHRAQLVFARSQDVSLDMTVTFASRLRCSTPRAEGSPRWLNPRRCAPTKRGSRPPSPRQSKCCARDYTKVKTFAGWTGYLICTSAGPSRRQQGGTMKETLPALDMSARPRQDAEGAKTVMSSQPEPPQTPPTVPWTPPPPAPAPSPTPMRSVAPPLAPAAAQAGRWSWPRSAQIPLAWLGVVSCPGAERGRTFVLLPETIIGRNAGDVLLSGDPTVSGQHAKVRLEPKEDGVEGEQVFVLYDLASANGTYAGTRENYREDNSRTFRCELHDGDYILLGETVLTFWRA
jgi:alanyl-tRNA synthetase